MSKVDPFDFLMFGLRHFDIPVVNVYENYITLPHNYVIEIESNGLYRLVQDNQVIAPFHDVEELCNFILSDPDFNER